MHLVEHAVDGLQVLLHIGQLAFCQRGLGLLQQRIELLGLRRAGWLGAGPPGRFGSGGRGDCNGRLVGAAPGLETLHQGLGCSAIQRGRQGLPGLDGCQYLIGVSLFGRQRIEPDQAGLNLGRTLLGLIQRRVQRSAGRHVGAGVAQGLNGLGHLLGIRSTALFGGQRHGALPFGQQAFGVGRPALQLLRRVVTRLQGGVEQHALAAELFALLGQQRVSGQGVPFTVQRCDMVDGQQGVVRHRSQARQQGLRLGARLALQHGRFQALFGQAVHLAVVAAEIALGLAQGVFARKRLHGGQLDRQRLCRLGQPQQGSVVAQGGLQQGLAIGA